MDFNINYQRSLAGLAPLTEDKDAPVQEAEKDSSVDGVIKALRDTDYRNKEAFFKMVQLLKGLAVAAEDNKVAKDFMSAVSDALTTAAKKTLGESVDLDESAFSKKDVNKIYNKWFEGVAVDIFALSKIAKEIEGLLKSGADLDKEMPKMVKKYREN